MKKLKAYKYRLKPNAEKMRQINQHFGSVCFGLQQISEQVGITCGVKCSS
jgi:hypothetical protein